jgi:hypothetical protein
MRPSSAPPRPSSAPSHARVSDMEAILSIPFVKGVHNPPTRMVDEEMRAEYFDAFGVDSRDTGLERFSFERMVERLARHYVFWGLKCAEFDPMSSIDNLRRHHIASMGMLKVQQRLDTRPELREAVAKRWPTLSYCSHTRSFMDVA